MADLEIGIAGKVRLPVMPISCPISGLRRSSQQQKQRRPFDAGANELHRLNQPRGPVATGEPRYLAPSAGSAIVSRALAKLVPLEAAAWGFGQCSEWLEAIEVETGMLTGADEAALRACDFAVDEYARWTVRRTQALLRRDHRLPSTRRLQNALDAAAAMVADIGGFDHLYRRHNNLRGGCMVMGPLPERRTRRRTAQTGAAEVVA